MLKDMTFRDSPACPAVAIAVSVAVNRRGCVEVEAIGGRTPDAAVTTSGGRTSMTNAAATVMPRRCRGAKILDI
jgi:hypothetical protein